MTQQEIQERNENIARMLSMKKYDNGGYGDEHWWCYEDIEKNPGCGYFSGLRFHSDYNWLMEAVEFIEKLDKYAFAIDSHPLTGHCVLIHNATDHGITSLVIPDVTKVDKKEAVFIAVSDFAKLYNNKEL
jgi:hypothetical protein